jgi:hypothetical protein
MKVLLSIKCMNALAFVRASVVVLSVLTSSAARIALYIADSIGIELSKPRTVR